MIPVIHCFLARGYQVILGGSGKSGELLKVSFPELLLIPVPSPVIRYSEKSRWLVPSLIRQFPAMVLSVFREHRHIKAIVEKYQLTIVVSDNRYGLFCKQAYCIFVTHQVSPVLPTLFRWAEYPLYLAIRIIIHQYNECWIPDYPDPDKNLSGKLSHRFLLPRNAKYIGILSRFRSMVVVKEPELSEKYELVIVLSGPEPQRSILYKLLMAWAITIQKKTLLITGLNQECQILKFSDHGPLSIVSHLDPQHFRQVLLNARVIICRSGYSGIMDLVALGKTALLVPTPGQPEQEYLAEYMTQKGFFMHIRQDDLDPDRLMKYMNEEFIPQVCQEMQGKAEIPDTPLSDKKHD
jgi:hypothetical protein